MQYDHERHEPKWKEYNGPLPTLPEYAPHLADLARDYLIDRGLSPKLAGWNGWFPAAMDVPRLVIPCTNSAGTIYYQARAMDTTTTLRYDSPIAPRGDSIVTCYPIGKLATRAVVVEGPADALAAAGCGFVGIAVMGNNPAPEALELIVAKFGLTHSPFLILPDKDDEAFGATLVAAFATLGVASKVALMIGGKDLCELPVAARKKFFDKNKKG